MTSLRQYGHGGTDRAGRRSQTSGAVSLLRKKWDEDGAQYFSCPVIKRNLALDATARQDDAIGALMHADT
ncbi:hypothetical protein, partial [Gluconobacter oxydans]